MTAPPDRLRADLLAALDRLADVLREPKNDIVRDASIQRFEFALET
jgi:predicted transcriptional regulator